MSTDTIITVRIPASEKAHSVRDNLVKDFSDRAGVYIDPHSIKELTAELEERFKEGEAKLLQHTKKWGLKVVGRPDVTYGISAGKAGPIEFWYQIRATS